MILSSNPNYLAENKTNLTAWFSKEQRQVWMVKNSGNIIQRTNAERKYGAMAVIKARMAATYK